MTIQPIRRTQQEQEVPTQQPATLGTKLKTLFKSMLATFLSIFLILGVLAGAFLVFGATINADKSVSFTVNLSATDATRVRNAFSYRAGLNASDTAAIDQYINEQLGQMLSDQTYGLELQNAIAEAQKNVTSQPRIKPVVGTTAIAVDVQPAQLG